MGQYYKPVNLDRKEYMFSHDFKYPYKRNGGTSAVFSVGLKLMEHSYIGNNPMNAVEQMIIPGGDWYKNRLVWAGDYADPEEGRGKSSNGCAVNIYQIMENEGTKITPLAKKVDKKYRYLTNHTQKVVIDLQTVEGDGDGFSIHPLSLLICEGNGRGGGDFNGEDSRIGSWARDVISLENHIYEGYSLVDGNFREERRH